MPASLLEQFDVSEDTIRRIVAETIDGADDGELFMEYREGEALVFDNGRLKTANFNADRGFGLRAVAGEAAGYAHASEFSHAALLRASDAVSAVKAGYSGTLADAPAGTNRKLYGEENPTSEPVFDEKAKLLQEIDAWVRDRDPRVRQVTASLAASWQQVEILRADGRIAHDVRPLVRVAAVEPYLGTDAARQVIRQRALERMVGIGVIRVQHPFRAMPPIDREVRVGIDLVRGQHAKLKIPLGRDRRHQQIDAEAAERPAVFVGGHPWFAGSEFHSYPRYMF